MKWFLLAFIAIYLTSCTTAPVKKAEQVVVPPKKEIIKETKPFLKHVQKEDKLAFDEIQDNKKILHLQKTEVSKAMQKVDFWANMDVEEFNAQFSSNMYTKEGNDYIYRVCSTAKKDKLILLDFLNYDAVIDEQTETYEMNDAKERYRPLVSKNLDSSIGYCKSFKDILCKKSITKLLKRETKASLEKDLQNSQLNQDAKDHVQSRWYELHFCEAAKLLK